MTILSETYLLILHSEGFSLNTNILETNVINQAILVGGLFFVWNTLSLDNALLEKQNRKISLVQDSEKRLNEAVSKLAETKKQLSQAQVIILEIQKETKQTKLNLLNADYADAKNELTRKFNLASAILKNRERLIIFEIKQNLALLALKKVVSILEIQSQNDNNSWTKQYMQESIKMLGILNQKSN
jgi:F-type H+-transporting ATPase subunit b